MSKFDVDVQLTGADGNAFGVMAKVRQGLKKAGATPEEIDEYTTAATSGDYNHLIATSTEWVNVH